MKWRKITNMRTKIHTNFRKPSLVRVKSSARSSVRWTVVEQFMVGLFLLFASCQPTRTYVRQTFPDTYSLAYQEIYGHCYDSIDYPVVALDLYSDGITLNKNHLINGTGYNLYISDIFVPDSLLETGEYKSQIANVKSPITPYTFLPGRDFEGTPHGMYILRIEDSKVASIQVLDSGSFVYRNDSLLFTLYYRNAYGRTLKYQPTFTGVLYPWRKQ